MEGRREKERESGSLKERWGGRLLAARLIKMINY